MQKHNTCSAGYSVSEHGEAPQAAQALIGEHA